MSEAQVEVQAVEPQPQVEEEVFDVRDFPAGLRGALEAVLMVVEEPIDESTLAAALETGAPPSAELARTIAARYRSLVTHIQEEGRRRSR